jgi:hypothetical protein
VLSSPISQWKKSQSARTSSPLSPVRTHKNSAMCNWVEPVLKVKMYMWLLTLENLELLWNTSCINSVWSTQPTWGVFLFKSKYFWSLNIPEDTRWV